MLETPGLVVQDAMCGYLVAGTALGSMVTCQFRPLGSTAYITVCSLASPGGDGLWSLDGMLGS